MNEKKKDHILRMSVEDYLTGMNMYYERNPVNCYMLCNAVAKRARQLTDERGRAVQAGTSPSEAYHDFKPVSEAVVEFYTGTTRLIQ